MLSLPVMLPLALSTWPASFDGIGRAAWGGLAYVSVFSMLIGFVFWYRGLALGGIAGVGQLQLLQPFFGLLLAGLLLHEPVAWTMLAVTASWSCAWPAPSGSPEVQAARPRSDPLRSVATTPAMSGGSGLSSRTSTPVTGCSKPSTAACRAWRAERSHGLPGRLGELQRLGPEPGAVDGIADQRVADLGHMDPDLVGPARLEPAPHQARRSCPGSSSTVQWVTA